MSHGNRQVMSKQVQIWLCPFWSQDVDSLTAYQALFLDRKHWTFKPMKLLPHIWTVPRTHQYPHVASHLPSPLWLPTKLGKSSSATSRLLLQLVYRSSTRWLRTSPACSTQSVTSSHRWIYMHRRCPHRVCMLPFCELTLLILVSQKSVSSTHRTVILRITPAPHIQDQMWWHMTSITSINLTTQQSARAA